jgi:DNA modification methylase
MNAEKGLFGESPLADLIITSPPYANRLDYTRMWAPELEVLAAMWKESSSEIKSAQIGSTVVEGKHVLSKEEMQLPKTIRQSLFDIRNDADWKASESYYYPFFRNYAISMMRSLKQIENKLLPGGTLVVFVRDTVRKDIMFPTAELVQSVLVRSSKMKLLRTEKKVVRTHVGLLRKSAPSGMYGLAQLEWWLAFRKSEKA